MPLYEFACQSCRHEYEELVLKVNGTAPCPECGSAEVERKISRFAYRGGEGSGSSSSGACGSCSAGPSACSTCRR